MEKYKMICLDIDGTLLSSQHKILQSTKDIIHSIISDKKIPIILVSARMPKGILYLQEELNISEPIICYGGALIMDRGSDILLNKTISVSWVREIYQHAKELGVHVSLYKDDGWYVEEMDKWAKEESDITKIIPDILEFQHLLSLWDKEKTGPNKVLCIGEEGRIKSLDLKMKSSNQDSLNIYLSKPTYLEIMSKSASKTSAIEFLRNKLNIERSQIIAIGDNYNDIDMIEYAGLGIAMGNAPKEVKHHADYVTSSNDEDGVADAIKRFVF